MGNTLGYKKTTKIMKINGETIKLKTPVHAGDVIKDYPGYVLLESETVKHFGVRAKPLEMWHELKPKRLYFLVELPKVEQERFPRRARSGINMSAKDRLESLMLARRSTSDLSIMKSTNVIVDESGGRTSEGLKLKMRLPKSEVTRVMMESKDEAEATEKIMAFFKERNSSGNGGVAIEGGDGNSPLDRKQLHCKNGRGGVHKEVGYKAREKRVGFMPITEGEIQLAAAS